MRGTRTTTTLLRQSTSLWEFRGVSAQHVPRPAFRASTSSSTTHQVGLNRRTLHTTPVHLKKGATREKAKPRDAPASSTTSADSPSSSSQHPKPNPEDVLDFADVRSRIQKNDESAQDALKKIKTGGRFNPDHIGALKVQPDRKDGAAYPIRELAQIVPKGGRTISILVHEPDYVKPIMSAIQASKDFNQQPQRDPDNELELVLKIELEKREDVMKRVKGVCHEWRERIRSVRQKRDKLHVSWKKEALIGPDLKRKADTELDKVIKAKMTEIDAAEKEAMKAAEGK
ncbi:ribosomal recycling factor [Xylariales sp. AK1849]|nr:ribosomal recycling factor [Xylariales sp. AK1849]